MSLNHDLSDLFRTMAAVLEIRGEPVFKSISFSKVSRLLKDMTVDIKKIHDQGKLDDVEGIGPSSKKVIHDYITTGRSPDYEELVASIPSGLIPLLDIPSLGPKTISLFWKQRGITNMEELVKALDSGALEGLKGIGEKKLQGIKQGIELLSKSAGRMGIVNAMPIATALVERLRAMKEVKQAEIAGSLRRWKETVGDVDLVCSLAVGPTAHASAAQEVSEAFTQFPEIERVLGQGTTKASVLTVGGLQVDLRIVPVDNFGAALLYFTGSKDHNVRIRGLAQDHGLTLNEWGLYKTTDYDRSEKKTGEAPSTHHVPDEASITEHVRDNLEFQAFETPWSDADAAEMLKVMRSLLTERETPKYTPKENLITFAEDRLMVEFPDASNPPRRRHVPRFNFELPKDDPAKIIEVWETTAPELLRKWWHDLQRREFSVQPWRKDAAGVTNKPGLYRFREEATGKIVYVGMAGVRQGGGLRDRLTLHTRRSKDNSSFRKHIAEWLEHQGQPIRPVASKTEEDIYKNLGLAFVPPELREDRGEVDAAAKDKLPHLIELKDIRGDLHSHTTASDGQNSIEEMAEAAKALGYEFLAITDHSKSQVIANGLTADRLLKHVKAIHKANDKIKGITLLAGCEVDILADGHLDFDDHVLAELDFVVASPHVALKQDSQKATDRILRAIDTRYVNVIGHPTGRLIGSREGLPLDIDAVVAAAAANGTALEINSGYPRLDLNDVHARAALHAGVMLSINTDAHSTDGFGEIVWGLHVARRAWATKKNVINCLHLADLKKFIARKR